MREKGWEVEQKKKKKKKVYIHIYTRRNATPSSRATLTNASPLFFFLPPGGVCARYIVRFLHVPPPSPTSSFRVDFGVAWWKNENHVIGRLSSKPRRINVINTLTQQEHRLEVCSEETIGEIQGRYFAFNRHAGSYTWKRLTDDGEKFVVLDMDKTLTENGVPDEDVEFEKLNIPDDYYIPAIHIYFNDDLTDA